MSYRSISFVTCVARPERYERCRRSIEALETAGWNVRIKSVQNLGNSYSAAEALNLGWEQSDTDLVVFCHEDVEFPVEWISRVDKATHQLEAAGGPPSWGVLGPVGRLGKQFAGFYGDAVTAVRYGPLPGQVDTLDELCMIVRRDLDLRFDESLGGFHLYGADLAMQCTEHGLENYAIDAFVWHHTSSRGSYSRPAEYHRIRRRLQRKWRWRRKRIGKRIGTTCGQVHFGWRHGWF